MPFEPFIQAKFVLLLVNRQIVLDMYEIVVLHNLLWSFDGIASTVVLLLRNSGSMPFESLSIWNSFYSQLTVTYY